MVTPRPLRLKSQVGALGKQKVAPHQPIARVWVDTAVYHLDSPFDYWVPETLSTTALPGVRIQVEFGNSVREAIVIERAESAPNSGNLKQILKVLSPHSVATSETLDLISLVARRWAGTPFDILRSAIPPRISAVDKEIEVIAHGVPFQWETPRDLPRELLANEIRAFWSLPPSRKISSLISEVLAARLKRGQVLFVAPDERQLLQVEEALLAIVPPEWLARLDGHISRAERYRNYLRMKTGNARIAIGLRGSIFVPLEPESTIVVMSETSELLYEPRTPGWNVRDVALMRAHSKLNQPQTNLIFLGFSPSLELARLIESGWMTHLSSKGRRNVSAASPAQGELLPSKLFSVVRTGLKSGPVLFLVPRKGYGNAVLCKKCRNISLCECGGRLEQKSLGADPQCVLCSTKYPSWHCTWCQETVIYIASRGIDRFSEEIGKAFPNFPVLNSSGDHIIDSVPNQPSLIVATPGSQPEVEGGYAAVALLEGDRFFGQTDLRANEVACEHFFRSASLVSKAGAVFVALDPGHPIVSALTRWDSTAMIRKELHDREELKFPPFYRFISLESDSTEATSLHTGLESARREGRISSLMQISGPHPRDNQRSRVLVSAPFSVAPGVVDFLHELQRRRSISHKALFTMRVDPFSLTR